MELRIAGIDKESVVDGPGLRFVVYTQGCPHACLGCHNPQTHDPNGGYVIDTDELANIITKTKLIRGVTFSGGEPFMQAEPLAHLAGELRTKGFNIITYSGFVFEQLMAMSVRRKAVRNLLKYTDILVDGPYLEAERDLALAFRGSRNQRLIDVPCSLEAGRVVLWEDAEVVRLQA